MTRGRSIWFCLLAVIAAGLTTKAVAPAKDTGGFPYQKIIDRNAFALKDPPPPAPDPATIKPPPPKITATGIANIFGIQRALLKVLEPAKPPAPAQEQSYILSPGERQGEVEVLSIDEKTGSIRVNNYGTMMVLELKTNLPTATAPAPGSMPVAGAGAPAASVGGVANLPVPGSPFTTIGGTPVPPGSPLQSIPMRTLRLPTPAAPPTPQAAPQGSPMSLEEQTVMMELLRMDPNSPPLPPTPLTPQ